MSVKLTNDEIAYYKGDEKFHIGKEERAEIGNNYDMIVNHAYADVRNKRKRRQLKDFNNKSEYDLYNATLFSIAVAAEHGF